MVGKTSRCFVLVCLLALTLLFSTASLHASKTAAPPLTPLESLWQMIVTAACDHGISIGPGGICGPVTQSGCERGPLIDPNGGCSH